MVISSAKSCEGCSAQGDANDTKALTDETHTSAKHAKRMAAKEPSLERQHAPFFSKKFFYQV